MYASLMRVGREVKECKHLLFSWLYAGWHDRTGPADPAAAARRGTGGRTAGGRVGGTGRGRLRQADDGVGGRPREDGGRGAVPALAPQGRPRARRHPALRRDPPGG